MQFTGSDGRRGRRGEKKKHGRAAENRKLYIQLTRVHSKKKKKKRGGVKKKMLLWLEQELAVLCTSLSSTCCKPPKENLTNPEMQNLLFFVHIRCIGSHYVTFNRAETHLKQTAKAASPPSAKTAGSDFRAAGFGARPDSLSVKAQMLSHNQFRLLH